MINNNCIREKDDDVSISKHEDGVSISNHDSLSNRDDDVSLSDHDTTYTSKIYFRLQGIGSLFSALKVVRLLRLGRVVRKLDR